MSSKEDEDSGSTPSELSWKERGQMLQAQIAAQNAFLDSFMLLFLKRYDSRLSEDEKRIRDRADKIVLGTSLFGTASSFVFIVSQLSLARGVQFNPIRDLKFTCAGIAFMLFTRTVGILTMWNQVEPVYFRVLPRINFDQRIDFYADNTLNPFKIFLYRNVV